MIHRIWLLILLVLPASVPAAQGSLESLLQEVRRDLAQERRSGRERVEQFRIRRDQRRRLLEEARAAVAAEQARSEALRTTEQANRERIDQLTGELEIGLGDLREVFGLVRQSARENAESLAASLNAARLPQQVRLLRQLAESRELPDIQGLEALWLALLEGMAASARVERFEAPVITPQGSEVQRRVTRIGPFSAFSEGRFLRWLPESERFVELARQPAARLGEQALALEQAPEQDQADWVEAPVDPSRGALMAVLVQSPSLPERIRQGGPIGYAILALGAFGLLLVLERWLVLLLTGIRVRRQLRSDAPGPGNPLGRILLAVEDWRHLAPDALQHKLDEAVLRELPGIRRGLPLLAVLAAVAPLLGLLGTVAGMIETFQSITLFGTGDPKLMSGGISEALVTTELGLAVAVPLVLAHGFLSGHSGRLVQVLDQQSAALVARRVERDGA